MTVVLHLQKYGPSVGSHIKQVSQYLSLPDFKSELSDLLHGLGVVEREAAVVQLGIADLLLADVLVVQVPGGEQVQNGCLSPHTMVI